MLFEIQCESIWDVSNAVRTKLTFNVYPEKRGFLTKRTQNNCVEFSVAMALETHAQR